ncbi:hypothetical protein AB0B01_22225 [Streptomyces sp. NPDC044571]|uniref:hypothetical protein n=1 Tax=Streptomyces sp. NPDC044571 TaxID=3155371 RepID=UPI0033EAEDC3
MDFPETVRWTFAGLACLTLAALVREIRRLRRAEPGGRARVRWDAADQGAGLVLTVGGALGSLHLFGAGLVLTGVVLGGKAVRAVRARRRTTVGRPST